MKYLDSPKHWLMIRLDVIMGLRPVEGTCHTKNQTHCTVISSPKDPQISFFFQFFGNFSLLYLLARLLESNGGRLIRTSFYPYLNVAPGISFSFQRTCGLCIPLIANRLMK